jgi:hypothetical protein
MLLDVVSWVGNLNIYDLAILAENKLVLRVNEAAIRLDVKSSVTLDNLLVELWVNLNSVGLNQSLASLIVTLRLDALNLAEQLAGQSTELNEVVYNNIALAILLNDLDNIVSLTLLVAPLSDKLAVTHM